MRPRAAAAPVCARRPPRARVRLPRRALGDATTASTGRRRPRLLKPGLGAIWRRPRDRVGRPGRAARRRAVARRRASGRRRPRSRRRAAAPPRRPRARGGGGGVAPLAPLRNTELARVPRKFRPLSSAQSRARDDDGHAAVHAAARRAQHRPRARRARRRRAPHGRQRARARCAEGGFFSLEALEAEVKADETVGVVEMPGWLLSEGVRATHRGEPSGLDACDGIEESDAAKAGRARRGPAAADRLPHRDQDRRPHGGQSPPFTEYYTAHPSCRPRARTSTSARLMGFFSRPVAAHLERRAARAPAARGATARARRA